MKLFRRKQQNTAQRFGRPSKGDRRDVPANRSKVRLVTICLYVAVTGIGLGYLFINKQVSTSGYDLRELEISSEKLTDENKALELKIIQLQSLSYLQSVSEELALQPSTQVTYVGEEEGSVALQQ